MTDATLAAYARQRREADRLVRNALAPHHLLELFTPRLAITAREACLALHIPTTRRKAAGNALERLVASGQLASYQRLNGEEPTYVLPPEQLRQAEPEDLERRRLCIICRDRERSELLLPCRHLCVCLTCFAQMEASAAEASEDNLLEDRVKCPVCRGVVEDNVTALFA